MILRQILTAAVRADRFIAGFFAPRNYLDKTLVGRVHWISPNGQAVMAYFWEADNPGVSDGRAYGYLGDAEIKTEAGPEYKIGEKILGKVSRGVTMTRMSQELSWQLLHMTREQVLFCDRKRTESSILTFGAGRLTIPSLLW